MSITHETFQTLGNRYGYKIFINGNLYDEYVFTADGNPITDETQLNLEIQQRVNIVQTELTPTPKEPTAEEYLMDLDYRLTCVELGL